MDIKQIRETLLAQPIYAIEQLDIEGVRVKTWQKAPAHLGSVFQQMAQFAEREYLVYGGDRITYQRNRELSLLVAATLVHQIGVKSGDRVAVAMRNYPEYVSIFWGCAIIGAVVVPLNAWWSEAELRYALMDSGACVLFADRERLSLLEAQEFPDISLVAVRTLSRGHLTWDEITSGSLKSLPETDINADAPAAIMYTSGTTGKPKGAVLSHRNIVSAIWTTMFGLAVSREFHTQSTQRIYGQKTVLITTPLFHVIGLISGLVVQTFFGGRLVLMRKWDAENAARLIQRERVTSMTTVPVIIDQLIDVACMNKYNLSSLERISVGGAPSSAALVKRLDQVFPDAMIGTGWGMTETGSPSTHAFGRDLLKRPSSVGLPTPVCEIRIVNEDGNDCVTTEQGELWVRGPNVIRRYWNHDKATRETFIDGYVRTGDVVVQDDEGYLVVVDRLKDMIIRGGENVYCVEVEQAIQSFGGILEVAVLGIPHEFLGEAVAAVLCVGLNEKIDLAALKVFLAARIARFKVPTQFVCRNEPLPRNAIGKVQKHLLKEQIKMF